MPQRSLYGWVLALALLSVLELRAQTPVATDPVRSPAAAGPATLPAVNVIPTEQPTNEEVGDAMMAHQRYQAAIAAYQKEPVKTPGMLNKIGIAYQMMLDTEDAIRYYKASLKLDGKNARVHNNLGTAFDAARLPGQAEKSYKRAIKLNPQFALAYKNLATLLMKQHNFRGGAAAYKRALELDPGIFEDRNSLRVPNQASAKERGVMNFYMALGCARSGQLECALNFLQLSINQGYATPKRVAEEQDFAVLRGMPAFEQMMHPEQPQ